MHNAFEAVREAERFVAEHRSESVGLVLRNAQWRSQPATEKQLTLIKKRGVAVPGGLTKGQASHIIGMLPRKGASRRA